MGYAADPIGTSGRALLLERLRSWRSAVEELTGAGGSARAAADTSQRRPLEELERWLWCVAQGAAQAVHRERHRPWEPTNVPLERQTLSGILDLLLVGIPAGELCWDPQLADVDVPRPPRYSIRFAPETGGVLFWCPMDEVHQRWSTPAVDHYELPIPYSLAKVFSALSLRWDLADAAVTDPPLIPSPAERVILATVTQRAVGELRRVLGPAYVVEARLDCW